MNIKQSSETTIELFDFLIVIWPYHCQQCLKVWGLAFEYVGAVKIHLILFIAILYVPTRLAINLHKSKYKMSCNPSSTVLNEFTSYALFGSAITKHNSLSTTVVLM